MHRLAIPGVCLILATSTIAAQQPSDTIVRRASAPRHPGIAELVPEVSIGMLNGPAEYLFTNIHIILPMPDGAVLIADVPIRAMSGRAAGGGGPATFIRWYDAGGRFVRPLGRHGLGPGEYVNPAGLARLPDGRILLRDASLHRINVYAPGGEPLATWRIDEPANHTSSGTDRLMVDHAGIIYLRDRARLPRERGAPLSSTLGREALIRLRPDGTVIDTLAGPVLPDVSLPTLRASRPGRSIGLAVPFAPWGTWEWSPLGYFVTGVSNRYAIDLRIPPRTGATARPPTWRPGDPVVSIRRQVAPVEVGNAERAAHRARIVASLRETDPRWEWTGPDVPRVKPAFRRILIGNDGRIWVDVSLPSENVTPPAGADPRYEESVPFRQPRIFEVFEPDGTWLGRVRVPDQIRLHAIQGDVVWGETRDADDVPSAVRYRVDWR
jgi:hypothetical protein